MNKFEKIKNTLEKHKKEIRERFHVKTIGIFGSYVRGDYKSKSDLDILVEFDIVPGLFSFIQLKEYLSQLTGVKVDVVMKRTLKPYIGKRILQEVIYL
jgi:predicted nucleotidyltransferase